MSRMTRVDYTAGLRQPKRSFRDVVSAVQRAMKRKAIADGHILDPATAPPKWDWHWTTVKGWKPGDILGNGGIVRANTKGEARAQIKRALGISKSKSLTMCSIERTAPGAYPSDTTVTSTGL